MNMRQHQHRACAAILVLAALVVAGCEAERATQAEIIVSPSFANIAKGGSVAFTASGWHDYTWSLAAAGLGGLSRTKGDTTVYTSTFSGAATQILTVVGATGISPNPRTGTNAPSPGTAYAPSTDVVIIHR